MKNVKKHISLILMAVLAFSLLNTPVLATTGTPEVANKPVQYSLIADGGISIPLWAYEIDGSAYFKLRDIAMALSGTEKQFEVTWDESKNAVMLTTGTAYTSVGGELSEPTGSAGTTAKLPDTNFFMDGGRIPLRSYLVNGNHYVNITDLAANILFSSDCDDEKRTVEIRTEKISADIYSFSLPKGWRAEGDVYNLNFTRSDNSVGSLTVYNYYPDNSISQFQGNHAETLSSGTLSGFDYPTVKAIIRRTQPAAAQDDSYVDELHIYILLSDLQCAFDFCFDSAKVDEETAVEIAKSLVPKGMAIKMNTLAAQWAKAIKNRDGKAQYELLSAELQPEFKDYYESINWVTGVSSPWVNGWRIEASGNQAIVFYENETSERFAGYTIDTLSFSEENGQLKISGIDGFNNFPGYSKANKGNVPLPESSALLASLPDDQIFMYGDKNDYDINGGYNGLYLSINGVNRYYTWQNIGKDSFLPALCLEDINCDGQKELVVILTTGEGTGVNQKAVHVINPENFVETGVTDPLDIIAKNIVTSIVHENGSVTVTVTVNGQKTVVTLSENYTQGWAEDRAAFGSIVTYEADGAGLKAAVPAQISNTLFAGEVIITYTFDGSQYSMKMIEYVPYEL
jgi:hypothetical protein